jgi:anti-anti-sigma regulatory factor
MWCAGGKVNSYARKDPVTGAASLRRLVGNRIVVRVAGDLRGDAITELRRTVLGELKEAPEQLVIDLSDVTGPDTGLIKVLESAAEWAGEEDISLSLAMAAGGPVHAALIAMELVELFEIFPSVTAALQTSS